ncbi:phosphopantetheine adenylyltransferase [Piscinibacter sp.]|uniref:phosphopantetheine adenylyltransferase n=1 Tax=Piscinibacter sp. TaxID=1903157 RepID=UPI0039E65629
MRHFIATALIVVAIIHLLPVVGVLGPPRLAGLYGVSVSEPNLELLLRHRAILFGIIGLLLAVAAFRVSLQPIALLVGLASVVSFLALAWIVGPINAQLHRVVIADVLALILLLGAGVAHLSSRGAG